MLYNCTTCTRSLGIFMIGGIHKVRCSPTGLRDLPLTVCSGWAGYDDELLFWPPVIETDIAKWRCR